MNRHKMGNRAFTIIELFAVIVTTAVLGTLLVPVVARTKASSQLLNCSNNLKQIGTAFHIWAASNGDECPMRVSVANGGYASYVGFRSIGNAQTSRGVSGMFLVMSNELNTPRILMCPAENEQRIRATAFSETGNSNEVLFVNDLNTSYFVGVDALTRGVKMFLSGDHNLGSDGSLVPASGFVRFLPYSYGPDFKVSLGTNFAINSGVGWQNTMHSAMGNVLMSDCSVQQMNRMRLQQTLRTAYPKPGPSSPYFPNPTGCTGQLLNRIQFP